MVMQGLELSKQPHIVVATPGRLADHLDSCDTFSLQKIKFLVLDEADRLLGGHFDEQLTKIFAAIAKQKQVLLFSATMTDALDKVKSIASDKVYSDASVYRAKLHLEKTTVAKFSLSRSLYGRRKMTPVSPL